MVWSFVGLCEVILQTVKKSSPVTHTEKRTVGKNYAEAFLFSCSLQCQLGKERKHQMLTHSSGSDL